MSSMAMTIVGSILDIKNYTRGLHTKLEKISTQGVELGGYGRTGRQPNTA